MSSRIDEAYRLISLEIEWLEQEAGRLRRLRAELDPEAQTVVETKIDEQAVVEQAIKQEKAKPKSKHDVLKCPHCDLVYKSQGWLDRHMASEHTEAEVTGTKPELRLRCEDCDWTDPDDAQALADHTLREHGRFPYKTERTRTTS